MDISGHWINQNGSSVELTERDGHITGWYRSRKGRSVADRAYAVTGVRNGELASFLVNWADEEHNVHAITAFSGRLVNADHQPELHTVWVLARAFEDTEQTRPTGAWNAFLTNADVFTRTAESGISQSSD